MNDPLVQAVPPKRLLRRAVAVETLAAAALAGNTFNRAYWYEVVHVWMCKALEGVAPAPLTKTARHTDNELAGLPRDCETSLRIFIAEQSYRSLDRLPVARLPRAPPVVAARLAGLLERIAERCTFEKTNDAYLHTLLAAKLPAAEFVLLEPPFRAVADAYGAAANALVRPLMVRDGKAVNDTVDLASREPEALISAAALLAEAIDGDVAQVCVNNGIHRRPVGMFALVATGARCGDQVGHHGPAGLGVPQEADPWPVASIVLAWARAACPDLVAALLAPETLAPGSGLDLFARDQGSPAGLQDPGAVAP